MESTQRKSNLKRKGDGKGSPPKRIRYKLRSLESVPETEEDTLTVSQHTCCESFDFWSRRRSEASKAGETNAEAVNDGSSRQSSEDVTIKEAKNAIIADAVDQNTESAQCIPIVIDRLAETAAAEASGGRELSLERNRSRWKKIFLAPIPDGLRTVDVTIVKAETFMMLWWMPDQLFLRGNLRANSTRLQQIEIVMASGVLFAASAMYLNPVALRSP
jgi:hypothetical protein